mmetsp:Transcript_43722/g.137308  ORF Transcript_43722/g.137308 Transcript_43722/m.137308 type:complete len:286 (+) Transcript_43722:646-1503(+)
MGTKYSSLGDTVTVAGAVAAGYALHAMARNFRSGAGPRRSAAQNDEGDFNHALAAEMEAALKHVRQTTSLVAPPTVEDTEEEAADSPAKSKLYTRTGDGGVSSLYNMERREKDDLVFEALGAVDELHAHLGVAAEHAIMVGNGLHDTIRSIQSRLIDVGAAIGTPRETTTSDRKLKRTEFPEHYVLRLERYADALDSQLPPLRNFILAGGGFCAAHLHVARTVCRRSERVVVGLIRSGQTEPSVGKFLNRLSDTLFAAARYAALCEGKGETAYRKDDVDVPDKDE